MADLTALDMAKLELQYIKTSIDLIVDTINKPLESGHVDCSFISYEIRRIATATNNLRDHIFTTNREQKGSDEAIQKKQMLYRKQQEREAEQAAEIAELMALKPATFSLD